MKKFFCYGKKDFCENTELCIECPHFAGAGGEYREVPKTNADRIRAMSDEELASVIMCPYQFDGELDCKEQNCFQCSLKWLQQPSGEEDKHEAD